MKDKFPERIDSTLSAISNDSTMRVGVDRMMKRASEFATPMAAKLTGIYLNPISRDKYDSALDIAWEETKLPSSHSEIVVGAGLHAAIYCAIRVKEGHPKPLVIEEKKRAGGAFAVSRDPSFYLNSRNRPGSGGTPGREESLNFLPGALVQPADLSGAEYQTNSSVAFAIRSTLAMYAKVVTGRKVVSYEEDGVVLDDGKKIYAGRVICAVGLGRSTAPPVTDGKKMMDAMQFFEMLDRPSPFEGLKRVAVIGAGDSGKTVVEALIGQGPIPDYSVASLDYVEKIDWYGVPSSCLGREQWQNNNRSRYQGIARAMRPFGELNAGRVQPREARASFFSIGYAGAYVDGARYDLVVWAGGFREEDGKGDRNNYEVKGRYVASKSGEGGGILSIGPGANLPQETEPNVEGSNIPENTVAVFRYADRTATLAMELGAVEVPPKPKFVPPSVRVKIVGPTSSEGFRVGDKLTLKNSTLFARVLRIDSRGVFCQVSGEGDRYLAPAKVWNLFERPKAPTKLTKRFVWTGLVRRPKRGETYLKRFDESTSFKASGDRSFDAWILRLKKNQPIENEVIPQEGTADEVEKKVIKKVKPKKKAKKSRNVRGYDGKLFTVGDIIAKKKTGGFRDNIYVGTRARVLEVKGPAKKSPRVKVRQTSDSRLTFTLQRTTDWKKVEPQNKKKV